MNICLVTKAEFNDAGSISTHVYKLANYYAKCDHKVFIVSTNWGRNNTKQCESYDNINIFNYTSPIRRPSSLKIGSNSIMSEIALKKLDKEYHFDLIHAQEGGQCFTHDIITAHAFHEGWLHIRNNILKNESSYNNYILYRSIRYLSPTNRTILTIEKYNYKKNHYKRLISISNYMKYQMVTYNNIPTEDIVVIPNGIDCNKFKPDNLRRRTTRKTLNLDDDDILLLFSGNDFDKKGVKFLISAFRLIKTKNVKLVITGRDRKMQYYKQLISKLGLNDKIVIKGFVPEIRDYYNAADIFVFPTLYEPFGLVITEALATGLPVITSKSAGAAELITDGFEGLLLNDPTNSEEIAEKICVLLENEKMRTQMGKNGRETAKQYPWDVIAKKTLDVYEEVIKA